MLVSLFRLGRAGVLAMLALLSLSLWSLPAHAGYRLLKKGPQINSFEFKLRCLRLPSNPSVETCDFLSAIWDPPTDGVTAFDMALRYDPIRYSFVPGQSGPLGIFSVGGDAPAPQPGVGTQPISLLPDSGYSPGAPLPGSTLTYTDVGGVLTVHYELASAVSSNVDINFFRTDFKFLTPIVIDLNLSTFTYETELGAGSDFSLVSFSCVSENPTFGCGSDTPSTGLTTHYAPIPEPSSLVMMFIGLAFLATRARRSPHHRSDHPV